MPSSRNITDVHQLAYWWTYCGTSIKGNTIQHELLMQTPQNGWSAKVLCDQRKRNEKGILSDSIYIKSWKDKIIRMEIKLLGASIWGREWILIANDSKQFFFEFVVTFYILVLVLVTLLHTFAKIPQTIYLRSVTKKM